MLQKTTVEAVQKLKRESPETTLRQLAGQLGLEEARYATVISNIYNQKHERVSLPAEDEIRIALGLPALPRCPRCGSYDQPRPGWEKAAVQQRRPSTRRARFSAIKFDVTSVGAAVHKYLSPEQRRQLAYQLLRENGERLDEPREAKQEFEAFWLTQ